MSKLIDIFESKVCPRCGGCGEYSYNELHGRVCYQCKGKGKVFTARGKEASRYYKSIREMPARNMKIGGVYFTSVGCLNKVTAFRDVTCIENGVQKTMLTVHSESGSISLSYDSLVRRQATPEDMVRALAYQKTL